ncbi:MAG: glycosyltransferase family 39 protein [Chloroflexota bacterium]|nr:glycosyltransferase family 39 protein [Chloroflexota bacterium]
MASKPQQPTNHMAASAIPARDDASAASSHPAQSASMAGRIAPAIRSSPLETRFLWVLLILFLAKGVIFTFVFEPFSGHDEVAHYAYLQILVEEQRIPVIPDPVAFDANYSMANPPHFDAFPSYMEEYSRFTTPDWYKDADTGQVYAAVTFLGNHLPSGWIYTANHPPLYYLLVAPVYWMTADASPEAQLYALRLAAIPLGMLTVLFAFLTARRLFPRDRFLAVTVPTLVAFQPQIAYEAAMLNNDILAIATTSACIYLIVVGLQNRFTVGLCAWLGLVLGLAMISKSTALVVMPVIAVAMIARLGWKNVREWLPKGAFVLGITAVIAAPWYAHMLATYGNFTAFDRIQTLQWWNYSGGNRPGILEQLTNPNFAWMRWRETWGEFGWRLIPLGESLLEALFLLSVVALAGFLVWGVLTTVVRLRAKSSSQSRTRQLAANTDPILTLSRWQVIGVASMALTCIISYYAVLQFGTSFALTQARYYFPAVNAAAIVVALGVRMITPMRWQPLMQTSMFVGMFLLNVVILSSYVIPYWNDGVA